VCYNGSEDDGCHFVRLYAWKNSKRVAWSDKAAADYKRNEIL